MGQKLARLSPRSAVHRNSLMNILYIHSHDTGRYVQPYGHKVATPRIQQLAEEGIMFRKAFCANPTCSPSRAALLTGRYAHSCGMMGLAHRGFSLLDRSHHLASFLRTQGYFTALAGVQHEAAKDEDLGYEEVLLSKTVSSKAHDVATAVDTFLDSRPERPFFLSVGFYDTHRKFPVPDTEDDARYLLPPAPLPDTPEIRADMAGFCKSASILDAGIGRVLDALERNGFSENTLVICTTDHGIAFPGMKCNLTDHGIGVMLFLRGPAGFRGGIVVDQMVSHIDLFPTICEVANIPPPDWLQGASLGPLVRGEVELLHEEIYAEVNFHVAEEPQRCVRTQRWKYIRRYNDHDTAILSNIDNSSSKTFLVENGLMELPRPKEMLFDLYLDTQEANNLAHDSRYSGTLQKLRENLHSWMIRTEDPMLASQPGFSQ